MAYMCAKCSVEMEEVDDIAVNYKGMDLPETSGLRCPDCGMLYLLEELVVDEVNPSEGMLETK